MLEQSMKRANAGSFNTSAGAAPASDPKQVSCFEKIQQNIDMLHSKSRQGLWHIAAFVLVSIAALLTRDIHILEVFPENVREILGAPPAPYLIHIVLGVSTISALVIIVGRLFNDAEPGRRWEQFGHRAVFYLFYFFSNALDQFFLVIFAAGLAVLLLEHYHIWNHFAKAISHEKELMRKISLWPLTAYSHENSTR